VEADHGCIHMPGGYTNVPETGEPIEDELRRRWLLAIEQLGAEAALKEDRAIPGCRGS
jgi:gluconate kinase